MGHAGTLLTSTNGQAWDAVNLAGEGVTPAYDLVLPRWFNQRWTVYALPTPPTEFPRPPALAPLKLESTNGVSWQVTPVPDWASEDTAIPPVWQGRPVRLRGRELQVADSSGNWTVWSTQVPDLAEQLFSDGTTLAVWTSARLQMVGGLYTSRDGQVWEQKILPLPMVDNWGFPEGLIGPVFGHGSALICSLSSGVLQSDPLTPTPPAIVGDVQTVSGGPDTRAVLRVRATGTSPLHYQWQRNGVDLPGATNQYLLLDSAPGVESRFRVIIRNRLGTVESAPVSVVSPAPATLEYPTIIGGRIAVCGTPGRRYQLEYSHSLGADARWYFLDEARCESERPVFVSQPIPFWADPSSFDDNVFIRAILVP